jgi:hypothetical protein
MGLITVMHRGRRRVDQIRGSIIIWKQPIDQNEIKKSHMKECIELYYEC